MAGDPALNFAGAGGPWGGGNTSAEDWRPPGEGAAVRSARVTVWWRS